MDFDIRERLENEMSKCNSLQIYKNIAKKCCHNIPNELTDNILCFVSCDCKKCKKTRQVLDNESLDAKKLRLVWEKVDFEDIYCTDEYTKYCRDSLKYWMYYFIQFNKFPKRDELGYTPHRRHELKYMKYLYKNIPSEDFDNLLKNAYSMGYDEAMRDMMIYILTTRGCKFYPQIFDEDFQNIALTIFK